MLLCGVCLQLPMVYDLDLIEWADVLGVGVVSAWVANGTISTHSGPWLAFILANGPDDDEYKPREHLWVHFLKVRLVL